LGSNIALDSHLGHMFHIMPVGRTSGFGRECTFADGRNNRIDPSNNHSGLRSCGYVSSNPTFVLVRTTLCQGANGIRNLEKTPLMNSANELKICAAIGFSGT